MSPKQAKGDRTIAQGVSVVEISFNDSDPLKVPPPMAD